MPLPLIVLIAPASFQDADSARFFTAKDWPGLETFARARIAANPKDGADHNLLGIALGNQGKTAEAQKAFEAAVAADPKQLQARVNLIMIHANTGDRAGTKKAFTELRKEFPVAAARVADRKNVYEALAEPPAPTLEWTGVGKGVISIPILPPYPYLAASSKVQGEVLLDITVDAKGVPSDTAILGGLSQFYPVSQEFASKWHFDPKVVDGKPVPSRTKLALVFMLDGSTC